MRDGGKGPHFEFVDFVPGVDFALQAELRAHGGGALAEFGRREDIAGFVDEGAGEVLRVGDDEARVEAVLKESVS